MDLVQHSECGTGARRDAPCAETGRRAALRRTRARARAWCRALAGSARSAVVAARRRLPSQPKMDDLISCNGFRIEAAENTRIPGPRTHTYLYEGRAKPA